MNQKSIKFLINFRVGDNVLFEPKMFTCDDKDVHQLHDWIVRKVSNKYNPIGIITNGGTTSGTDKSGSVNLNGSGPNRGCFSVVLKLFSGDVQLLKKENQFLFKTFPEVKKIGFPNVIMPGDVR